MIVILLRDMRGTKTNPIAAYQKKLLIECIKAESDLDLSYQNLTPKDLSNLFSAITAIQEPIHLNLNLSGNGIDSQGAKLIATFLKGCSIVVHLDLRYNKLSDEGGLVLQSVLDTKLCISLDLRYNKMTKEGIATLANRTARMNVSRDDGGWIVEEPDSEEIQILFEEASKAYNRVSKITEHFVGACHRAGPYKNNPPVHFIYNPPSACMQPADNHPGVLMDLSLPATGETLSRLPRYTIARKD